jgi:hypothetical protein
MKLRNIFSTNLTPGNPTKKYIKRTLAHFFVIRILSRWEIFERFSPHGWHIFACIRLTQHKNYCCGTWAHVCVARASSLRKRAVLERGKADQKTVYICTSSMNIARYRGDVDRGCLCLAAFLYPNDPLSILRITKYEKSCC